MYFSYQAILSYKPNDENHFRILNSLSYRSPFLYNQFANTTNVQNLAADSLSLNLALQTIGNKDMDLMSSSLYEIGWRRRIGKKMILDVEGFHSRASNFSRPIRTATDTLLMDNAPVILVPSTFQNDNTLALQTGITASLSFISERFTFLPFITFQHTELQDYSPFSNDATAENPVNSFDPTSDNIELKTDVTHEGTPNIYGGFNFNYNPGKSWNINLNAYFFSEHTFYHNTNVLINDGVAGVGDIGGKFLLNTKVNYSPNNHINVYGVVQNIFNDQGVEYIGNDAIGSAIFFGINFNL